jgi:hypothetical protein
MVRRVALETGTAIGEAVAQSVSSAVGAALAARDAAIEYDHDSRILHPGRTVLILLSDTDCRTPAALAAAAFVESIDAEFALPPAALADVAGADAARLLGRMPVALPERLLEELVSADDDVALIRLAERLDHARHLHLRDDLDWPALHLEVCDVWIPAAHRFAPRLARRFERWEASFRRRLRAR